MTVIQDCFFTASDGLRLYYRDHSPDLSGPVPVLCLPGLTRSSKDFDELAAILSTERRVICADLRGRGRSAYAPSAESYNPLTELNDTLALLKIAGISKAVFIGTSRGGLIAILAAAVQPDVVAGMVLNDIGPEISSAGMARIMSYAGQMAPVNDWAEAVAQMKSVAGQQFPTLGDAQWLALMRKYYIVESGRPVLAYDPQIGIAMRAAPASDPPPHLWGPFQALPQIPALVIRGELSDILSAETVGKMQEAKPDLKSVVIKDQGHAPFLETPEALAAIKDLLYRADLAVGL